MSRARQDRVIALLSREGDWVTAAELADDRDPHDEAHGSELTTRALRYATIARELDAAARRWRDGTLS